MHNNASLEYENKPDQKIFKFSGEWTIDTIQQQLSKLDQIKTRNDPSIDVDAEYIDRMDTAGAWFIYKFLTAIQPKLVDHVMAKFTPQHQALLKQVADIKSDQPQAREKLSPLVKSIHRLGQKTVANWQNIISFINFVGQLTVALAATMAHPSRLRLRATVHHLKKVGFDALPIVGLISFLIGVVLVYQGSYQLKRFGAEIFTVDLLAVSAMREIGILLTAIVIAGRSGSAFTAQIGYMKLNQEIDALQVLGLSPFNFLVIPRLIALIIALPLLAFYADIMALIGGGVMCMSVIGLDFNQFIHHAQLAIKPWTFWTGIIKAPVFAIIIAAIGCFEGLCVSGGAESVGERTTRSVVESIFLVIIIDAMFSIMYSYIGI